MKKFVFALAAVSAIGLSGPASAASPQSTTFQVLATVVSSCIVAATDLMFLPYDGTSGTDSKTTSYITLVCAGTSTAKLELDNGQHFASGTRKMQFYDLLGVLTGTDTLGYGLFQPVSGAPGAACGTTAFGSGTAGLNVTGLGLSIQSFTVCGTIPKAQAATAGAYRDVVTVTATF